MLFFASSTIESIGSRLAGSTVSTLSWTREFCGFWLDQGTAGQPFRVQVKTNSEKGEYQKRGRQIYGLDYVPKSAPKAEMAAAELTSKKA
jgi:hypothetical protein